MNVKLLPWPVGRITNSCVVPIAVLITALRCSEVLNVALVPYIVWSALVILSATAGSCESGSILAALTLILVFLRLSSLYHVCHLSETVRYTLMGFGVNPLDNPLIRA